jgi:formamidopyrimidine-DNA glycosylase
LYYSGIHPFRIGNTITDEELELLRVNSHQVMVNSYNCGGLTIEDFKAPSGEMGEYPTAIYMRERDDLGNLVLREKYTQSRRIWYVAEVQSL